jgi:hypothetical protein
MENLELLTLVSHKYFFATVTVKNCGCAAGIPVLIHYFWSLLLTICVRLEVKNTNHRHSAQPHAGE